MLGDFYVNNEHNLNFNKNIQKMNLITERICGICGEAHNFKDCTFIHITNHVPDSIVPKRAKLTLPDKLRVEKMTEGTYSILATDSIEKGTQYGPFEANKSFTLDPEIIFPLKIFTLSDYFTEYFLETNNENNCNWMMYVQPAFSLEEQNLVCYQEDGKVYYVSVRTIHAGEYLKVWYSPYYAKRMKKPMLTPQHSTEMDCIDLNSLIKKQQNLMERDTWTCKFCSMQEKDVTKFAKHISEHYSLQIKKICEVCKSAFSTHKRLKKHMQLVHGDLDSAQLKTQKEPSKMSEEDVIKDTSLGGPLLNDMLIDSMDNTNILLQQTELSQFDMSNIGNQDMLLESDNLNLGVDSLLHENGHFNLDLYEDKEQYICDICLKPFAKLQFLVQHLRKHTGKFTCTECFMVFSRKESLKEHNCSHKQPQYKCLFCDRFFRQKKYVTRHIKSIHEKKNQCQKCNKLFYCAKEFREHNCANVPESEKPKYPCLVCNKVFYRESYMKKHMNMHMPRTVKKKSETHVCEICAKTLQSSRYLHQHLKKHYEPTYSCDKCDKRFTRRDTLIEHIISFHSPESHSCVTCGKVFKSRKALKCHMSTHLENKRIKCSGCDEHFSQKSNMIKHYKKTHMKVCKTCKKKNCTDHFSDFPSYYKCPFCKNNVKLRSSLIRHIKKIHPRERFDFSKIKEIKTSIPHKELNVDNPTVNEIANNGNAEPELNSYLDKSENNNESLDNLSLQNLVENYGSSNIIQSSYDSVFHKNDVDLSLDNRTQEGVLDFNNLELDLDPGFTIPQDLNINNQEVCLSMPELTDLDRDITLGENAYMLDNGTIVEPLEPGNVVVYILDEKNCQ